MGEYNKAIADCTEAIRLQPNLASAFRTRGEAFAKTGELEKALADYAEARKLASPPGKGK
jgi:tetratricopeptide (TPR) repeat protein